LGAALALKPGVRTPARTNKTERIKTASVYFFMISPLFENCREPKLLVSEISHPFH
jgi:hypothetical protein